MFAIDQFVCTCVCEEFVRNSNEQRRCATYSKVQCVAVKAPKYFITARGPLHVFANWWSRILSSAKSVRVRRGKPNCRVNALPRLTFYGNAMPFGLGGPSLLFGVFARTR